MKTFGRSPAILLGFLLLLFASPTIAGWDTSTAIWFDLLRMTSPRSHSLAKISSSIPDDPLLAAVNPAILGFVDQPGAAYSYSNPLGVNWLSDSRVPTMSAWLPLRGVPHGDISVGLSYSQFYMGEYERTDEYGITLGTDHQYEDRAALSVAAKWNEATSVGVSFLLYGFHYGATTSPWPGETRDANVPGITISVLQSYPVSFRSLTTTFTFGATGINLNRPKLVFDNLEDNHSEFPVLLRLGPSVAIAHKAMPIELGIYSEYQSVLNSAERSGWRAAAEFRMLDTIMIRFGRFVENLTPNKYAFDDIRDHTLGVGLRVPFEWFAINSPVEVRIDYTSDDQEYYNAFSRSLLDPFTLYSVRVSLNPR